MTGSPELKTTVGVPEPDTLSRQSTTPDAVPGLALSTSRPSGDTANPSTDVAWPGRAGSGTTREDVGSARAPAVYRSAPDRPFTIRASGPSAGVTEALLGPSPTAL